MKHDNMCLSIKVLNVCSVNGQGLFIMNMYLLANMKKLTMPLSWETRISR